MSFCDFARQQLIADNIPATINALLYCVNNNNGGKETAAQLRGLADRYEKYIKNSGKEKNIKNGENDGKTENILNREDTEIRNELHEILKKLQKQEDDREQAAATQAQNTATTAPSSPLPPPEPEHRFEETRQEKLPQKSSAGAAWKRVVLIAVLLLAGPLAVIVWREMHPAPALVRIEDIPLLPDSATTATAAPQKKAEKPKNEGKKKKTVTQATLQSPAENAVATLNPPEPVHTATENRAEVNKTAAPVEVGRKEPAERGMGALKRNEAVSLVESARQKRAEGNWQGALDDYNRAIQLDPGFAEAIYNRANTRYKLQDYEGAYRDYSRAIELRPGFANAYYNRGMTLEKTGKTSQACQDFKKADALGDDSANKKIKQLCND